MSGILAFGRGSQFADLLVDISNQNSPNIPAMVQAAGWVGTSQKIILRNTGLINTMSILTGVLSGADITLINASGAIIGGDVYGSTALTLRIPVKIQNLGWINAAGGQGGAGATAWISRVYGSTTQSATGSPGGGSIGQGFTSGLTLNNDIYSSNPGATGTLGATGSFGGGGGGRGTASATGGNGGTGGSWGQAGSAGSVGSISGDYDTGSVGTPGAGQQPGYYIDGASFATWLATGTRLGRSR